MTDAEYAAGMVWNLDRITARQKAIYAGAIRMASGEMTRDERIAHRVALGQDPDAALFAVIREDSAADAEAWAARERAKG